jgi:hypothetical protein
MNATLPGVLRSTALAAMAAVALLGCATSRSKRPVESASAQTAATRTVILVPIVILSPMDNNPAGSNREPLRETVPPAQSVGHPGGGPANPRVNL